VTVSESISNNTLRFAILEYSGLATSNSLDLTSTAAAQGNGTAANSGNATTAAGNLVLGAVITGLVATYTAGSGYTIEERVPAAPNTKLIVEDQIQGTAGGIARLQRYPEQQLGCSRRRVQGRRGRRWYAPRHH